MLHSLYKSNKKFIFILTVFYIFFFWSVLTNLLKILPFDLFVLPFGLAIQASTRSIDYNFIKNGSVLSTFLDNLYKYLGLDDSLTISLPSAFCLFQNTDTLPQLPLLPQLPQLPQSED